MAVVARMSWAATEEEYDRVRAEVGWVENPSPGGRVHIAFMEGGRLHVVDVWDDEASLNAFLEQRLFPAVQRLGISGEMTPQPLVPVHELYVGAAEHVLATPVR